MTPLVSFCIATYKREDRLSGVINSILDQTVENFEIVITDNDIDSKVDRLIKSFKDSRIRYYKNQSNLGMVKSFNRALSLSRGKYITMITDDDPVYPNMLQDLVSLTKKYSGFKAYFGACSVNIEDPVIAELYGAKHGRNLFLNNSQADGHVSTYFASEFYEDFLNNKIFPYFLWSCGIVDRTLALKIGGMPDYGSPYLTDFGYVLLVGSTNGMVIINKTLGEQTIHKSNFGREQYGELIKAVDSFNTYITSKLITISRQKAILSNVRSVDNFSSKWLVNHLLFVNKYQIVNAYDQKEIRLFNTLVFSLDKYSQQKINFYLHLLLFKIRYWLNNAK